MKYQKVLFLAILLFVLFYVVQYFKSMELQEDHDHNGYPDKVINKANVGGQNSEEKHEHNFKADQGPSEKEIQHIDVGTHENTDEEANQDVFEEDQEQNSEQVDALSEFCVIAAIFNPVSFKTQYERYEKFKAHILTFGVRLITIELAYKNQSFQVTQPNSPNNIQLVTEDVLWYKENLINIAVNKSTDCTYIAWLDIELEFLNRDWVKNTIEALEKNYKLVQPFEMVRIKGLKSEIVESFPSFSYCHVTSKSKAIEALKETYKDKKIKSKCVSDFAWAAKKETLDEINGLFDKDIVGFGDHILVTEPDANVYKKVKYSDEYIEEIKSWQTLKAKYTEQNYGYVNGVVSYSWHCSLKDRAHKSRIAIVTAGKFTYKPKKHVYYDQSGLLRFKPDAREEFSNGILKYFVNRNEDNLPNHKIFALFANNKI